MAKKVFFIPELYRHVNMEDCSFNVLESSNKFSLNNMHTNSGYSNHANTGCSTHTNTGCSTHTNSGYSDYSQSGCATHTNSGYSNYYSYTGGCSNNWYEYFNYSPGWVLNGYAEYSHSEGGCGNHSNSGYSNHTNKGCATHSNDGYSNHSNSGYSDHSNTGANNHSNYSNNYSPTITGSCLPASGTYNQTITLDWRGCTIKHQNVSGSTAGSDSATNAVKSYFVYYKRGTGGWVRLASGVTAQTYVVNTASWDPGVVTFAITAYDGIEESVVFNSSTGAFSAPSKGHPDNAALSASYITTGTLSISHYSMPTWKYVVYNAQTAFRSYDLKEIHDEIIKASNAFSAGTNPVYYMTTKTLSDGSQWARIFHHNNRGGTVLFTSLAECQSSRTADKISYLNILGNLKGTDGKYEFLLEYPDDSTGYNRWKQTNNPCDEFITQTSDGSGVATGYTAVSCSWTQSYWGGLTRQNSSATVYSPCYLSGSVGHGNWFYAIGAASTHGVGIPTWNGSTSSIVDLWVRLDTMNATGKTLLSDYIAPEVNKDLILKSDLTNAQSAANTVYKTVKGSDYTWTLPASSVVQNKTTHLGREILELRDSLEKLAD